MMAIKKCSCVSLYQDKRYGKGKRVYNECKGRVAGSKQFRCTVCERTE